MKFILSDIIIYAVIAFVVVGSIIYFFDTSNIKKTIKAKINGYKGERYVAKQLKRLPDNEYKVINNLLLKTDKGTTQIDHVVISVYGIFVIENKNYKGMIRGNEDVNSWKLCINHLFDTTIHNPMFQNYGHVKAIQKILKLKNECFIPITVFSPTCNVMVCSDNVTYYDKLFTDITNHYIKVLSEPLVDSAYKKLTAANVDSFKMRRQHVKYVKTLVERNAC